MREFGEFIRDCRPEEADALLALWQQADATPSPTDTLQGVRHVLAAGRACVLVADIDGQLVGSIIGTFDGWRGNIYRLAVHPAYRRRGIARALLQEVQSRIRAMGGTRISALVERDHPWAVGFWDAVGYGLDHRIVRYVRNL